MDGDGIVETIDVEVNAWKNPRTGDVFFDGEARKILEKAKARHMGLLTPDQIRELRGHLGLTQKEISELIQIGEKTWTRWETGRERPSRSLNVLLNALLDGRIDTSYLRMLRKPGLSKATHDTELVRASVHSKIAAGK